MATKKQPEIQRRAITPSRRQHIDGVFKARTGYSQRARPQPKVEADELPAEKHIKSDAIVQRTNIVPDDRLERAQLSQRNSSINRFHQQPKGNPTPHKGAPYPPLHPSAKHVPHTNPVDSHQVPHTSDHSKQFWLWRILKKLYITIPLSLVMVTVLGWFVYNHLPQVSLQLINLRSGFTVSLPDAPDGFHIRAPISYSNRQAIVTLARGNDYIDLSQQPSSLDSSSLSSKLEWETTDYQGHELLGRTIFIRQDAHQASWVNKGVLYRLSTNFEINQEQIFEIAESL